MTNKEIEKMLSMLDSNDLISLKQYLLDEQKQHYFEKYCSKPNPRKKETIQMSSNYFGDGFTNGNSLYVVGGHQFNFNTKKIKSLITNNKVKLIKDEDFDKILDKTINLYGEFDCSWFEIRNYDKHIVTSHFNFVKQCFTQARFDKDELMYAKILLDDPDYKISNEYPILMAESKTGKVYIYGQRIL